MENCPFNLKNYWNLSAKRATKWDLPPFLNFDGSSFDPETWRVRCCLQCMPPYSHTSRVQNFMAMHDKSYTTSRLDLPPIKENGWSEYQGAYVPVMCLLLPAPQAAIELTKCGCKSHCKGCCGCFKSGIPCTPLCKCCEKKLYKSIYRWHMSWWWERG